MKSVLIVDDEKPFLESVKLGFTTYESDFKLYTAENGQQAVQILASKVIDIVVTDVKMPVMDGFELLSHISDRYPSLPVIVMSAYADTDMKKKFMRMGTLGLLEKPLDFDDLASMVNKWLQMTTKNQSLTGISLESFLQLIELEQKTYLLKVVPRHAESPPGFIYAYKGELYDAICGDLKGEEAIFKIVTWDSPKIIVKKTPVKKYNRRIERSIMSVLLEASRLKDESESDESMDAGGDRGEKLTDDAVDLGSVADETMEGDELILSDEQKANLSSYLDELKTIKGYRASVIMTETGACYVSDTVDTAAGIDGIDDVANRFNAIFNEGHTSCADVGLDAAQEAIFLSSKGLVVMLCSGADAQVHFHTIAILDNDGNQALTRLTLKKMTPQILTELIGK